MTREQAMCANCGDRILRDENGWFHALARDGERCRAKPGGKSTGQGDLFAQEVRR